jgi:hypothetical protein
VKDILSVIFANKKLGKLALNNYIEELEKEKQSIEDKLAKIV